jgi:alpha-galactosidase
MESWVTDMGAAHLSLEYRFHVSMCGALGVGGNLLHWSAKQRAEAAALIARYKAVRHIVQSGDLFRLRSPAASPISALQYVSKDRSEGLLFAFRTHMPPQLPIPPILLRGLDPQARYRVEGIAEPRSGAAWMQTGLCLGRAELRDFHSIMRHLQRVDHD